MLIKVNISGELLKQLDQDCAENFRTRPQTILYHLSKVYSSTIDSTETVPGRDETVRDSTKEVQELDHIESRELPNGVFDF